MLHGRDFVQSIQPIRKSPIGTQPGYYRNTLGVPSQLSYFSCTSIPSQHLSFTIAKRQRPSDSAAHSPPISRSSFGCRPSVCTLVLNDEYRSRWAATSLSMRLSACKENQKITSNPPAAAANAATRRFAGPIRRIPTFLLKRISDRSRQCAPAYYWQSACGRLRR